MSDAWFADKLAPDGDPTDGCHPDEAQALRSYLEGQSTAKDTAQAITRPVATSSNPQDHLPRLYSLLFDALTELPAATTAPLLDLIRVIEALPAPDFSRVPAENQPAHGTLWRGLPGFGHFWADRVAAERRGLEGEGGAERDEVATQCARQSEVEARLVRDGLAGLDVSWGYECVTDALERSGARLDAEVPMACAWLSVLGGRFREGADAAEGGWALQRGGDLWQGEDRDKMSRERWQFWIRRLRDIADDETAPPRARDAARHCVGNLQ